MWICSHKCTCSHFNSEMMSLLGVYAHVLLAYGGCDKRSYWQLLLHHKVWVFCLEGSLSSAHTLPFQHVSFSSMSPDCRSNNRFSPWFQSGPAPARVYSPWPWEDSSLLTTDQWHHMTHVPESQLVAVDFEHLSKSMCLFSSSIPTYQKWMKSCPTSGLGMNFPIL